MSRYECEDCGLAAMDLPDGIDPEFVFERDAAGVMRCGGCESRRFDDGRVSEWTR